MDTKTIATLGARLERDFDKYADGDWEKIEIGGKTLTVLRSKTINCDEANMEKCLVLRDESDGSLYFHFRGTGDGYWEQNAPAAYYNKDNPSEPSKVQKESREFFEKIIEEYQSEGIGNVYVTGHSQGGNTAQYVTISSKYADYITQCVSLDGPGFSKALLERIKAEYGEAYYERQRAKLFAYNGDHDYVSTLGEVKIIPDTPDRTKYIETRMDEEKGAFYSFHCADYLLDGDELCKESVSSDFREALYKLTERLSEYPEYDQGVIAITVMRILETFLDNGKNKGDFDYENILGNLSEEDLQALRQYVIPFLADVIGNYPEELDVIVKNLGLSPEVAELIHDIIKNFNDMPEFQRVETLLLLTEIIKVEDNHLVIDKDIPAFVALITELLPVMTEAGIENLDTVLELIRSAAVKGVKEHPIKALVIGGITIGMKDLILGVAAGATIGAYIYKGLCEVVNGVTNIAKGVKNGIINCVNAMQKAFKKFSEKIHQLTPGYRYASANPYFKVDTTKLRNYASRISRVNKRLQQLDSDLNSLYWQVGLLDIHKILAANLLTGKSYRIVAIGSYLTQTAQDFENADNAAMRYLEEC